MRNGPRPGKRAAAEATLRALDCSYSPQGREGECPKCRFTARPAHARRGPFLTRHPPRRVRAIQLAVTPLAIALSCAAPVARRVARQPTAWPSARPTGAVAAPTRAVARTSSTRRGRAPLLRGNLGQCSDLTRTRNISAHGESRDIRGQRQRP